MGTVHYYNRRSDRGSATRAELWITVIVLVAVIAAIAVFLLVYHDLPFRPGGSAV